MIIHKKWEYTFTRILILIGADTCGLFVDPLEKKLYYVDSDGRSVDVMKLETGEITKIVNKTTSSGPWGLAVDLKAR